MEAGELTESVAAVIRRLTREELLGLPHSEDNELLAMLRESVREYINK